MKFFWFLVGLLVGVFLIPQEAHAQFVPECRAFGAVRITGTNQAERCELVRILTQVPYSDLHGLPEIGIVSSHEFFTSPGIVGAWTPGVLVIRTGWVRDDVVIHEVAHNADYTRVGPGQMGERGRAYVHICITSYACQGIPAEWYAEAYQMCHTDPLRLWQMAPQAWNEICSR